MQISLDKQAAQVEFAEIIGVSESAVSDMVRRGVIKRGDTLGRWLLDYCANLRENAAGRDAELARERARLAREQADRIAMKNAIDRREYAPIAVIEETLADVGRQIAVQLDAIPVQLKREHSALTAEDFELVTREIAKIRNLAAEIRPSFTYVDGDEEPVDGNLESGTARP